MADKDSKQPESAAGKWYVDTTCVPCHACVDEAPTLLKYSADEDYVYFHRQPETPEEEQAAEFSLQACPTEAIGNDGA